MRLVLWAALSSVAVLVCGVDQTGVMMLSDDDQIPAPPAPVVRQLRPGSVTLSWQLPSGVRLDSLEGDSAASSPRVHPHVWCQGPAFSSRRMAHHGRQRSPTPIAPPSPGGSSDSPPPPPIDSG